VPGCFPGLGLSPFRLAVGPGARRGLALFSRHGAANEQDAAAAIGQWHAPDSIKLNPKYPTWYPERVLEVPSTVILFAFRVQKARWGTSRRGVQANAGTAGTYPPPAQFPTLALARGRGFGGSTHCREPWMSFWLLLGSDALGLLLLPFRFPLLPTKTSHSLKPIVTPFSHTLCLADSPSFLDDSDDSASNRRGDNCILTRCCVISENPNKGTLG
jgi:hypothetical protein